MLDVIVIGAGPGGLSAAARAAALGLEYRLLEASPVIAKTIFDYQKNKPVMAEPSALPLRSDLGFTAGRREEVLDVWETGVAEQNVSIEFDTRATSVTGQKDNFVVQLENGSTLNARNVVMAMGLQGNPRQLGVPGENDKTVQYTLVDADEFNGETIVVIGAGDAAIENAIALSKANSVIIVNRRDEFARAKDGNLKLIQEAIESKKVRCFYSSQAHEITPQSETSESIQLSLNTPSGQQLIACNRIIARLGAVPPRNFLERSGVTFPNDNPNALPELSEAYESEVPGLFIIGAIAGNPLIKQAMNQGYEVIQHIVGQPVDPADHGILQAKLESLPFATNVNNTLKLFQKRIPFFNVLSSLQFRELMVESDIIYVGSSPYKIGHTLFQKGDYSDSFLTVVDGELIIKYDDDESNSIVLKPGQFFGELGIQTGQRRIASAVLGKDCVLVETPRRTMVKLISSNEDVRKGLDSAYIVRALQFSFSPSLDFQKLTKFVDLCELKRFSQGEPIFNEDEKAEFMYLVRAGSVSLYRGENEEKAIFTQVRSGDYFGESAVLGIDQWRFSAEAANDCELVCLTQEVFRHLVDLDAGIVERFQSHLKTRLIADSSKVGDSKNLKLTNFLLEEGMKEATDLLVIHDDLCVGCDNCEVACAETHGGTTRLDRAGGLAMASLHVPIACRHCEVPHCMSDCPPDAIKRDSTGEVYIEDTCIGCGNCVENCPYDVVKLAYPAPKKPGLLNWLFFGAGSGPGQQHDSSVSSRAEDTKKAVKCDACRDIDSGPACVNACPTGAAIRLAPIEFEGLIAKGTDA